MCIMATCFTLIFAFITCSSGLKFSAFTSVSSGVSDVWNKTHPQNVKNGGFTMKYGNGNLWLVSDPPTGAGIVSTLRLSTKAWTHKTYDRVTDDAGKLFVISGRLFMLTYSTATKKVVYHKMFFWKDEDGKWVELPFEIDPKAMTEASYPNTFLSVSVPNEDGSVAYAVASAHKYAQRGSEMAFAYLQPKFNGTVPVKATLKGIVRHQVDEPSAVFFTFSVTTTLYALVENMYSEGYEPEHSLAYTVGLVSPSVGTVKLPGPFPPMGYSDERMFSARQGGIFIAGGYQVYGLGQVQPVHEIWSLSWQAVNMSTILEEQNISMSTQGQATNMSMPLEGQDTNSSMPSHSRDNSATRLIWQATNSSIPPTVGNRVAFDQGGGKLYLAGLKEGISVSQVT